VSCGCCRPAVDKDAATTAGQLPVLLGATGTMVLSRGWGQAVHLHPSGAPASPPGLMQVSLRSVMLLTFTSSQFGPPCRNPVPLSAHSGCGQGAEFRDPCTLQTATMVRMGSLLLTAAAAMSGLLLPTCSHAFFSLLPGPAGDLLATCQPPATPLLTLC
jgi:hypothetical protein